MTKLIRTSTIPMSLDIFCRDILAKLKTQYEVIALSSEGDELQQIEEREGVRTIAVHMERQIAPYKDIISLYHLIAVFKRERPTVVHSMTPKAGLLCMLAAWMCHVPVRMHTFTGLVWPTARGWKRKILILTDIITIHCATHVIAEGEGVKQDLQTITHRPIDILGYGNMRGIDMQFYQPFSKMPTRGNANHFLYVGRIVNDKGICELIEAFIQYYQIDQTSSLTMIGTMEEADGISDQLRHTIMTHPAICYISQQPDVRPYYHEADCLILPSYREGFPNVVLEAGAMALPCIVTNINGSREIIVDNETGLIVPPHDSQALFQAIRQIASNPNKARQMGQKARKRIEKRWNQEFVHQCLFTYYNNALCSIK